MSYPFQRNYIQSIKFVKAIWEKILAVIESRKEKETYQNLLKTDSLIKAQKLNTKSIPVLIINYNQLFYLEQLIDFLT